MLRLEEFGSLGCVKEAHGGGHEGRAHSGTWWLRELPFYYYRGKLVRGQGTRFYSRVVISLIHSDTVTENNFTTPIYDFKSK